jgi:2',3'-cyclic-nucleotide 2'-phosphodiesterase/3'-nucleotidase
LNFPVRIKTAGNQARLRVMATSDVHGNLLPHDYFHDRPTGRGGLAGLATLIEQARQTGVASLLLDNGDFLQGTPLADVAHEQFRADPDSRNAIIAAMNALDYDAASLGNHEFDWGLSYILSAMGQARFPLLAGNALRKQDQGQGQPLTSRSHIVTRRLEMADGRTVDLRIGILGLTPSQTAQWDARRVGDAVAMTDMVETARHEIPRLRADGADLVIALAHTGIETDMDAPQDENVGTVLARLDGIDALVLGHTHVPFPHPSHASAPGVCPGSGTIHGKPAVNPGAEGAFLGLIDLALARRGPRWEIVGHDTRLVPVQETLARQGMPPSPAIIGLLDETHRRTLAHIRRPIGHSEVPIDTYLSRVRPDAAMQVVNAAQTRIVVKALAGTDLAQVPVLSAATPFKSGGRGGSGEFVDIPAGPLALRHAADLYPYPNTICAIEITGLQLRDWLERAASVFARIEPGQRGQPLFDPRFPGYFFDVIAGIDYDIDLAQPARFGPYGDRIAPEARRLSRLHHAGRPVRDDQRFVLATNSYRLGGGGYYDVPASAPLLFESAEIASQAIAAYFSENAPLGLDVVRNWGFAPIPGASATFATATAARSRLPGRGLHPVCEEPHGVLVCELDLDVPARR